MADPRKDITLRLSKKLSLLHCPQHKTYSESEPLKPDQWYSVVEIRQHACRMRSFIRLERAILKQGVAANAVRINRMKHGTDYFFTNIIHADKLLDFIKGRLPVRISETKELVSLSHDTNDYKYTFSVEVCPICRDDLVFLPPKVASSLGNIGPIVICTKVTNNIVLFDPLTSTRYCLDGDIYWIALFKSLLTENDLVEYLVLDVKEICSKVNVDGKKFCLTNVEIARVKDLGKNDMRFNIKTRMGYLLKTGDHVLGYDLWEANCSDSEIELKEHIEGGVILMMKICGVKRSIDRVGEHKSYLKDLEEITNEVFGISLGGEEPSLEEELGNLNLCGEEEKEKKKARRMA